MLRYTCLGVSFLFLLGFHSCATALRAQQRSTVTAISLEQIMADPDWIGNAPQSAYWADDGKSIFYSQKRVGGDEIDLIQMDLDGNTLQVVKDSDRGQVPPARGSFDHDRSHQVFTRNGDLFLLDRKTAKTTQLTRTIERESSARFVIGNERVLFERAGRLLVREVDTGLEFNLADLRTEDDPEQKKEPTNYLRDQQHRLIEQIASSKSKRDQARKRALDRQRSDPTRMPMPWYLGSGLEVRQKSVSPDTKWILLRLAKRRSTSGKRDNMPRFVAADGYVANQSVRSLVGTSSRSAEQLVLLDLTTHEKHDISLTNLPGIADDPLKPVKDANAKYRKAQARQTESADNSNGKSTAADQSSDAAPTSTDVAAEDPKDQSKTAPDQSDERKSKPRDVRISSISWSEDGSRVVLQAFSADNKDRWIAEVDLNQKKLIPLERMHNDAWINTRFAAIGWLKDNQTIYFLSEESGYSQLYLRSLSAGTRHALTSGDYEVSRPQLNVAGDYLYFTANRDQPGIYEAFRVPTKGGEVEQLSRLGGQNRFQLSPDEKLLLITHSTATRPPELWLQPNEPGGKAKQLTQTTSDAFKTHPWIEPQFVTVPSRSGQAIHARLYRSSAAASKEDQDNQLHPAVIFIHGAGYLQNAHQGWSGYFREFMFHSFLVQHGFVVLDMDYRASAGYGRNWRTAIYRQMGTPEVEDLLDGREWLVKQHGVDPGRVGLYGGSYGGFLTLMALFKQPGTFACGAALRPVTDWAHYNHGYTSNILNTPQIDPQAYERSSPIEFADGLADPLLICHGMVDDNVFFKDTVRLVQRLIELKKQNFETAIYPVEPHGFREPTSWLDEYRRIFKLFQTHLR